MNEKELRYMKCIAEAGSIQKAAVLLRKNPSSLSRAVHRVEEDMDIILFKRTPEGLRPTQEGVSFPAYTLITLVGLLRTSMSSGSSFSTGTRSVLRGLMGFSISTYRHSS